MFIISVLVHLILSTLFGMAQMVQHNASLQMLFWTVWTVKGKTCVTYYEVEMHMCNVTMFAIELKILRFVYFCWKFDLPQNVNQQILSKTVSLNFQ